MDLGDIRTARLNLLGERRLLIEAITDAHDSGVPPETIASAAACPGMPRQQISDYLATLALRDKARVALAAAGLTGAADAGATWDLVPAARVTLTADPAETDDFDTLADRVHDAIRQAGLDLAADGDPTDQVLVDEESARIVLTPTLA